MFFVTSFGGRPAYFAMDAVRIRYQYVPEVVGSGSGVVPPRRLRFCLVPRAAPRGFGGADHFGLCCRPPQALTGEELFGAVRLVRAAAPLAVHLALFEEREVPFSGVGARLPHALLRPTPPEPARGLLGNLWSRCLGAALARLPGALPAAP
jgi:hypothetical protein